MMEKMNPRNADSSRFTRSMFDSTRSIAAGLAIVFCISVAAVTAQAAGESHRDAAINQLKALESAWPGQGIQVSVPSSGGAPLRIGDDLRYAFESKTDGYLTAVHIDTHGAATLLYPRTSVEAGRIGAGQGVALPSAEDAFSLQAQPPVGRDFVFAIVTEKPVSRSDLGVSSRDIVVSFEPQDAPGFLRRLRATLDDRMRGGIQVAHVVQQVDGRGDVQYRSADIVDFFGERTRSIRPPKLDLQVQFQTNSSTIDDVARRNIQEFARALEDPKLVGMKFKVAGHTDDVGSSSHNLSLSRKRADAVRGELVKAGVDASRLVIEAHGENELLMTEDSAYARQMNRRVEFIPAR